jgi:hypothetical protein
MIDDVFMGKERGLTESEENREKALETNTGKSREKITLGERVYFDLTEKLKTLGQLGERAKQKLVEKIPDHSWTDDDVKRMVALEEKIKKLEEHIENGI